VEIRSLLSKSMQLYREPFRSEPDLYFYFTYEAFEQRLETLRRLLQSGESLTLVIGDPGSGKTTLLQRYLTSTDGDWKTYRLRIPGDARHSKTEVHPAYLLRTPAMLMMIDDAHRLGRRGLQFLIQEALSGGPDGKMRLVLLGEPKIEKTIVATVRAIDGDKAVNRIYMPRLAAEESGEYLRHRLTVAGYSGPALFSRNDARKLHRSSGGLPGQINTEARGLLEKRLGRFGPRRLNLIRKLRSGFGLTCFSVMMLILLVLQWTMQPSPARIEADERPFSMKFRPAAAVSGTGNPPSGGFKAQRPVPNPTPSSAQPPQASPLSSATEAANRPTAARLAVKTTRPPIEPIRMPENAVHGEEWLLHRDPGEFTIQILAVCREEALLDFVAKNQLSRHRPIAYYRTEYRGSPWYPLLYGFYRSLKEAEASLNSLPSELRGRSPWIRKMAAVQSTIQNLN
jgi:type II secretory pathway predicted ATPase ExeA